MDNFLDSLEYSIFTQNWYAVLFISLSLPDICGKIDSPTLNSSARTINWFNKYLLPRYTISVGPTDIKEILLSGEDFYALRCAYLHEGSDVLTGQKIQKAVEDICFTIPNSARPSHHRNRFGETMQLQIDLFAREILNAVRIWLNDIKEDQDKTERVNNLMKLKIINL
ncbi:hypothetical protein R4646_02155 [Acinetobacter baumannii]|nr:hypothetical protein [Acinetobacter baumannii]